MGAIRQLDNLVAQRIAAGEVIDRPQSVVRELIDNAIDAGSDEITLYLEGGGIDKIKLIDNGSGISREDLPLATKRHATSKISNLDDLYHLHTLGFRGEALYSIAAVSRLTIASAKDGDSNTYIIDNSDEGELYSGGPDIGTQITVEDLFFHIPARKSFLKRPATEGKLCKQTFIQKALASPHIDYRLYMDGVLRLELPSRETLNERVLDVIATELNLPKADFITAKAQKPDHTVTLISSKPSLYRSDRTGIKIYLNNRQIDEFSLVQAVTYGYGELLPGGSYPYSYVFIDDDPEMVDFNIHPAKREAKIRNGAAIHHTISVLVKESIPRTFNTITKKEFEEPFLPIKSDDLESKKDFTHSSFTPPKSFPSFKEHIAEPRINYSEKPKDTSWLDKAKEIAKANKEVKAVDKADIWQPQEESYRYLGQAFNLFLIAQKGDKLYLVDQHAAHERILYDRLKAQIDVQKLLVPIDFEVDPDVDLFLQDNSELYTSFGIMIGRKGDKLWTLTSIPSLVRPIEKQIIEFIQTRTGDTEELDAALYAIIACKAAIKAGDKVDEYTAKALLDEVFKMEDPSCPHGRTFVVILEEEELRKLVGRTK